MAPRKRKPGRPKRKVVVVESKKIRPNKKLKASLIEAPPTQDPDLLIPPSDHFLAKVSPNYIPNISEFLKKYLSAGAISKFRETIFGWVLDMDVVNHQAQLVHGLCLREAHCRDVESMVFKVGGTLLKFGLEEFAIMTGLKVVGDLSFPNFEEEDYKLTCRYFPENGEVKKSVFKDFFMNRRFGNDDDAVKMAVVLVISFFLNTTRNDLSMEDFAIVQSGKYVDYPWGLASFKALVSSLKGRLLSRHAQAAAKNEKGFHYCVYGCPPALMCWFYECCPRVEGVFAQRVNQRRPRMLNWKTIGTKKSKMFELKTIIFDYSGLQVANLVATEEEMGELPLEVLREKAVEREKRSSKAGICRELKGPDSEDNKWTTLELEVVELKRDYNAFKESMMSSLNGLNEKLDELAGVVRENMATCGTELVKAADHECPEIGVDMITTLQDATNNGAEDAMEVVPAFLYYNGRWNDENEFIDYEVVGITINKYCSYEALNRIVAQKLKLDYSQSSTFDIRFQAKEGHRAMRITDDGDVQFYWEVINMVKQAKAYPLCVSVS